VAEEAGDENFLLFGFTAAEVAASRGWYHPQWYYEMFSSSFSDQPSPIADLEYR
jgi:hypothetical protein